MISFLFDNIGWVLVVVGTVCYTWAAARGRDDLRGRSLLQKAGDIVSHLPRDDSPPWPHVVGGISFFSGLSLVLGGWIADGLALGRHYALELSGFFFAVLVAAISFWTLWQTRRLDIRIGTEIDGFKNLIERLTRDAERLWSDSFENRRVSGTRFRFLLVTKNPLFGQLSFPTDKATEAFRIAMLKLAARVPHGLTFGVVCADENTLATFNAAYFTHLGSGADDATASATMETQAFINELDAKAGIGVVRRLAQVPPIQFAIVGNRTYEFFLETTDGSTDIQRSQLIDEARTSKRFAEFFDQLAKHAEEHQGNANGPATDGEHEEAVEA